MSTISLIVLFFSAAVTITAVSSGMNTVSDNPVQSAAVAAPAAPQTKFFWNLLPWIPLPNFPTRRPATVAANTVATCMTGMAAPGTGCACGTARCTSGQFCNSATMTCLSPCTRNKIVPAIPTAGCACGTTGIACAAGRGCTTTCVAAPTLACTPATNPGNSPCLCGTTGICPTMTTTCTLASSTCA